MPIRQSCTRKIQSVVAPDGLLVCSRARSLLSKGASDMSDFYFAIAFAKVIGAQIRLPIQVQTGCWLMLYSLGCFT